MVRQCASRPVPDRWPIVMLLFDIYTLAGCGSSQYHWTVKILNMGFEPTPYRVWSHALVGYGLKYTFILKNILKNKSSQLHAISCTQQGRQREPSVKTLRSPLSAEFWRNCVLRGRTQRRACPRHQSEKIYFKKYNHVYRIYCVYFWHKFFGQNPLNLL